MPTQQRQSNKGVPGLATSATVVDDEASDSEENSDVDSYESETSDSDEEYGYTMATKEEYVPPVEVKKKTKTKGGKQGVMEDEEANENDETSAATNTNAASEWTQIQQKELEQAIKTFPKGTDERWDRIASKVGGKTKEECLLRFKYLATIVKNKKAESLS